MQLSKELKEKIKKWAIKNNYECPLSIGGITPYLEQGASIALECGNWIEVSDRLPEIDMADKWNAEKLISVRVLIAMKYSDTLYFGRYYSDPVYPHWSVEGHTGFDQSRITHWFLPPLPKIPEQ